MTSCECTPCRFCRDRLEGFRLYAATRETFLERLAVKVLLQGTPIIAEDGHPILDENGQCRIDLIELEERMCHLQRKKANEANKARMATNRSAKMSARKRAVLR